MFVPSERNDVITSTVCWAAMAALLVGLSFVVGPVQLLKLCGVPYWVSQGPFTNFLPLHFYCKVTFLEFMCLKILRGICRFLSCG